ncbi:HAMP domain-containing sensor histidine kinase [Paenibacillus campi]|uniref:HAMP domain-containing sensor histidine kinase n=1 Tax=Paenibacillus campi TaxID=3106031 RepID=UPI002AFF4BA5|nr:HAMP domain-containing sensor histidine kinase [Paenibacillus sp. SGZ-1009]
MDQRVKAARTVSLLSYWTVRYFIILCLGFVVIAVAAFYWARDTTMDSRIRTAGLLGQEVADRVTNASGQIHIPPNLDHIIQNRLRFFNIDEDTCVIITDNAGKLLFSRPAITEKQLYNKLSDDLSTPRDTKFMAINTPIDNSSDKSIGQVSILQSKKSLTYSPNELLFIFILLAILILSGWLTLYLLSRKLSRPLSGVAAAAQQICAGNYDVKLNNNTPEKEIQELVSSFEQMAQRLKHLEEWRALSLAGVTHELKTPVTSIKGLMMAVRDDVVSDEEAREFIDIALQESERMERMVSDLLDYNALAAGSVEVRHDRLDLQLLIREVVYQWQLTHDMHDVHIELNVPSEPLYTVGDSLRIQQIIVNLLNNGLQASDASRPIEFAITMYADGNMLHVEVTDHGSGVIPEDQSHIFERFYRGEKKKRSMRGLGLGLTYSQLLARAQGGELMLRHSSPAGSTFSLQLPR